MNRTTLKLRCNGVTFTAEVSSTPAELMQGLQHRRALPRDHGMLFVFPGAEQRRSMWMKDTPLALTVAWLRSDGQIVGLTDMAPHSTQIRTSPAPVKMALEMPHGWFEAAGIWVGDAVSRV